MYIIAQRSNHKILIIPESRFGRKGNLTADIKCDSYGEKLPNMGDVTFNDNEKICTWHL